MPTTGKNLRQLWCFGWTKPTPIRTCKWEVLIHFPNSFFVYPNLIIHLRWSVWMWFPKECKFCINFKRNVFFLDPRNKWQHMCIVCNDIAFHFGQCECSFSYICGKPRCIRGWYSALQALPTELRQHQSLSLKIHDTLGDKVVIIYTNLLSDENLPCCLCVVFTCRIRLYSPKDVISWKR